jgi:hypothetical protein
MVEAATLFSMKFPQTNGHCYQHFLDGFVVNTFHCSHKSSTFHTYSLYPRLWTLAVSHAHMGRPRSPSVATGCLFYLAGTGLLAGNTVVRAPYPWTEVGRSRYLERLQGMEEEK